jgi:hypothetical protein
VFWYYVAPFASDKWNVLSLDQLRPLIYDSETEALKAAVRSAEIHFGKYGQPSGVKVEENGRWRNAVVFGELPDISPAELVRAGSPVQLPTGNRTADGSSDCAV